LEPIDIGRKIRLARDAIGMAQDEFADKIKRDQRSVSQYENGKRRMFAHDLPRIAAALGVPTSYFFDDDPELDEYDQRMLALARKLKNPEEKQAAIDLLMVFINFLNESK